jgi:chromosome segregation ATPase
VVLLSAKMPQSNSTPFSSYKTIDSLRARQEILQRHCDETEDEAESLRLKIPRFSAELQGLERRIKSLRSQRNPGLHEPASRLAEKAKPKLTLLNSDKAFVAKYRERKKEVAAIDKEIQRRRQISEIEKELSLLEKDLILAANEVWDLEDLMRKNQRKNLDNKDYDEQRSKAVARRDILHREVNRLYNILKHLKPASNPA